MWFSLHPLTADIQSSSWSWCWWWGISFYPKAWWHASSPDLVWVDQRPASSAPLIAKSLVGTNLLTLATPCGSSQMLRLKKDWEIAETWVKEIRDLPADSPKIVTEFELPPNFGMFIRTHFKTITWSFNPLFPGHSLLSVDKKPSGPSL